MDHKASLSSAAQLLTRQFHPHEGGRACISRSSLPMKSISRRQAGESPRTRCVELNGAFTPQNSTETWAMSFADTGACRHRRGRFGCRRGRNESRGGFRLGVFAFGLLAQHCGALVGRGRPEGGGSEFETLAKAQLIPAARFADHGLDLVPCGLVRRNDSDSEFVGAHAHIVAGVFHQRSTRRARSTS